MLAFELAVPAGRRHPLRGRRGRTRPDSCRRGAPPNAFNKLDVASVWGDGKTVAADGSQIDTWENNLLAGSYVRLGEHTSATVTADADPAARCRTR
ncbi:Tn3 family transposase [Actinomadura nitritigenes]|uniref:Tn3 family transposase n=1 Tax=Actinomadura nitritigenes TaxID=134602 RepID=UPI003D8F2B93